MRFVTFDSGGKSRPGLLTTNDEVVDLSIAGFSSILDLIEAGAAGRAKAEAFAAGAASENKYALKSVKLLAPIPRPRKLICVGLNYRDHAAEASFEVPTFPTLFGRFRSSLIGHGAPLVKPSLSDQFDFEGEMVAVIGKGGRDIPRDQALDHVIGYSVFNDGSLRDYQMKTPQWTAGKNFDGTGAFGPWLVTADEVPAGAQGLKIETRLNGDVVQSASTTDMVFDVAELVTILSTFMTLDPGDVIVTGTPAGVGMARTPQLWMKDGDICEIEVEGIGLLRNRVEAGN